MQNAQHQSQFGETLKFYADRHPQADSRTGITIQYTVARSDQANTISIEIAPIVQPGTQPNWAQKITIQLTRAELTNLCSTLLGLKAQMSGAYHGQARNKGIAVYNNGPKGAMIVVSEQGRQMKHLLDPDQRLEMGVFVTKRQATQWGMPVSDTLAMLRQANWMEKHSISN